LKQALEESKLSTKFTHAVISQIQSRVLQIARSTTDIINIYTKTIDVMKLLDPSTLMLEQVSECFKHFLYDRSDTLKCIVNSIFDKESKLFE